MGTTVAAMVCVADCAKTSPSHFLERSKGTVKDCVAGSFDWSNSNT